MQAICRYLGPVAIAGATMLGACATAPGGAAGRVTIQRPIMLAADAPGGAVAAYAVFVNDGPDTALVDAACDCADKVELHLVRRDGPTPGMTTDWPLPLPAGSRTAVEPPGIPRHLMLIGLKGAVSEGETRRLRFKLADGRWIEADFAAVKSSTEAWRAMGD